MRWKPGLNHQSEQMVEPVSLIQIYVVLCEWLMWFQEASGTGTPAADGVTPATGSTPAAGAVQEGAKVAQDPPPLIFQIAPFLVLFLLYMLLVGRPQQKEQKRREEFLKNLKKNVKVVTNSGLIGTVVDISADGKLVTLRVDDTTRIRFLRSAIHGELDEKSDTPPAPGT